MFVTSRGITNEVYYVAQKVLRYLGSNSVDNSARLCHSPSTSALKTAIGAAATTCSYRDWFDADLIVFFGSNPANDQPVAMKYLHEARKRGTRVLAVNTYREPGLERYWIPSTLHSALFGTNITDRFFLVTVGGDLAFLNAVQKVLIERGWIEEDFIRSATTGFAELKASLEAQPMEALLAASGSTAADVEAFAREIAGARHGVLVWSMGITQHAHGGDTVRAIVNLGLMREFVGRPGTGLMPIRGHSGVQGGAEMGAYATAFPGGASIDAASAERFSRQWGFPVPSEPGLTTVAALEAAGTRRAGRLLRDRRQLPRDDAGSRRRRSGAREIPLRIHSDIVLTTQMLVEPAEDVYLLPARTRYEQHGGGTETTTERRVVFSPYVPGHDVGEARSEWEMLLDFARAVKPEGYDRVHFADGPAIREDIAAHHSRLRTDLEPLPRRGPVPDRRGAPVRGPDFRDLGRQGALPAGRAPPSLAAGMQRSRGRVLPPRHAPGQAVQLDDPARPRSPHRRRPRSHLHVTDGRREARPAGGRSDRPAQSDGLVPWTDLHRRGRRRDAPGSLAGGRRAHLFGDHGAVRGRPRLQRARHRRARGRRPDLTCGARIEMKRRRPAVSDPSQSVRDRAAFFLEAQDGPVSSELLAREVLGVRGGSETACASILAPMLGSDPRFARTSEGRWVLGEPGAVRTAEVADARPLRQRAWAVWSVESEGRAAAVVRVETGRIAGERVEPADLEALEDEAPTFFDGSDRAAAAGVAPRVAPGASGVPLPGSAWRRLGEVAGDGLHVTWEAPSLVAEGIALASSGSPAEPSASDAAWGFSAGACPPPEVLSLSALARAALGPPRPRSLEHLATALGLTFVEAAAPLARARLGAACLAALLEREPLRETSPEGLRAILESRAAAHPALEDPDGALRRDLEALPREPGVYRFFDASDRLLYVGKARDLRERVGSYFAARATPDPRTASWLGAVARIEHERSGSELEALLRESRQIARRAPAQNRQIAVHERTGRPIGNLVLVQSAERPGAVRVALVKDGSLAARIVLGPRGGGRERLREAVERLYFPSRPRKTPAAGGRRPAEPGPARRPPPGRSFFPGSGASRPGSPGWIRRTIRAPRRPPPAS
jgi:hypothetical protein